MNSDVIVADNFYCTHGKRVFDLVVAIFLLVFLCPILCLTWLAIHFTSHGGAVFAQERVGVNGKLFVMYKFRSMYIDHEEKLDMSKINEGKEKGLVHKDDDDPRVTTVGSWIRKTSIDELPQIFNVIKGDMSLVGPRALVPHMLDPYPEIMQKRNQVRPGITGLWQVSARTDNTSVLGMVKYDIDYIRRCSFWTDLMLVFKTPLAVLSMKGAQ